MPSRRAFTLIELLVVVGMYSNFVRSVKPLSLPVQPVQMEGPAG